MEFTSDFEAPLGASPFTTNFDTLYSDFDTFADTTSSDDMFVSAFNQKLRDGFFDLGDHLFPPASACSPEFDYASFDAVPPPTAAAGNSTAANSTAALDTRFVPPTVTGSSTDGSPVNLSTASLSSSTVSSMSSSVPPSDDETPAEAWTAASHPGSDETSTATIVGTNSSSNTSLVDLAAAHPPSVRTVGREPLIRGLSAGGFSSRPPRRTSADEGFEFFKCRSTIVDADYDYICSPRWTERERKEMRRIVRVNCTLDGAQVFARFNVIDGSEDPLLDLYNTEISCLECKSGQDKPSHYYITSVDVLKIVELLIGSASLTKESRRKERGRIRSNLVPFWSSKPINSKRAYGAHSGRQAKTDADYKKELAQRIMAYETRRPRGFDKDVRILEWKNLVPALQRALQSYYVRLPSA